MFNAKFRRKRYCEMMRSATVFLAAILSCMAVTGPAVAQSGSESSGSTMNSFVIASYSEDITTDADIISEIESVVNRMLSDASKNLADAPDFLKDTTGKIPALQNLKVHLKTDTARDEDDIDDAIAWVYTIDAISGINNIYFAPKTIDMLHKASSAGDSSLREQTVNFWAQVLIHEAAHLIEIFDECETTRHELLFVTNSSYREHVYQNGYVRDCGLSAMLPARLPPPDLTERDPTEDFLINLMLTLLYNDEPENSIALLLNALDGGLSGDLIGLMMSAVDGSGSDDLTVLLLSALDDDLSEGLTGLLLSAVDDNTPTELTGLIENADSGESAEETSPPMSEEDLKQAEDALGLTRTERRQIQNGLNKLGFEAGLADGIFGNKTRQAIRSWQQANGSQSTGYLNRSEADALVEEGKELVSEKEKAVTDSDSAFRCIGGEYGELKNMTGFFNDPDGVAAAAGLWSAPGYYRDLVPQALVEAREKAFATDGVLNCRRAHRRSVDLWYWKNCDQSALSQADRQIVENIVNLLAENIKEISVYNGYDENLNWKEFTCECDSGLAKFCAW